MEHPTNEYPTTPTFKKMLYDQVNVINMVIKKKNHILPLIRIHTVKERGISQILV